MTSEAILTPLMLRAAGHKLGVVPPVDTIATTLADVPGVFHASVASPYSPAGGVGWSELDAQTAAVGEALERYAAVRAATPPFVGPESECYQLDSFALFSDAQLQDPECAWIKPQAVEFISAKRLHDGATVGVPRFLVRLDDLNGVGVVNSTGMAAGPTVEFAIERGLQEQIERDALAVAWLHSLSPVKARLPEHLQSLVAPLGGDCWVVNITPAYSPFPVVAVVGSIGMRGRPRYGMGSACRPTLDQAIERAFLEWAQATLYVHVQLAYQKETMISNPDDVRTFEDHAIFYSANPKEWAKVALVQGLEQTVDEWRAYEQPAASAVADAVSALHTAGFHAVATELALPDLSAVGVSVVRVLVPGFASINADHQWPLLGGQTSDFALRFPSLTGGTFPNRLPHPLG